MLNSNCHSTLLPLFFLAQLLDKSQTPSKTEHVLDPRSWPCKLLARPRLRGAGLHPHAFPSKGSLEHGGLSGRNSQECFT